MSKELGKNKETLEKEASIVELTKTLKRKKTTLKSLKTRLKNNQNKIGSFQRSTTSSFASRMDKIDVLRKEISALAKKAMKIKSLSREDLEALKAMTSELNDDSLFPEEFQQYYTMKAQIESGEFNYEESQKARLEDIFQNFVVEPEKKDKKEIRKIFIELSNQFHPDRASSKEEQESFHQLQVEINEAYKKNDVQKLLELKALFGESQEIETTSTNVLDQQIEKLQIEIDFISKQIDRTSQEIKNLRQSEYGAMLTGISKAKKSGELDEMFDEFDSMLQIFQTLRDGLEDSIKINALSPILINMMQESMMDEDDFGMDLSDFFDLEDDDEMLFKRVENPRFPIDSSVIVQNFNQAFPQIRFKKPYKDSIQGRVITAVYDDEDIIYEIQFDSSSINAFTDKDFSKILESNSFLSHFFIHEKFLATAKARDTKAEAIRAFQNRKVEAFYGHLPQGAKNVLMEVKVSDDDLDNWSHYFESHLSFPFEAKIKDSLIEIKKGTKIIIIALLAVSEDVGFILLGHPKNKEEELMQIPLIFLEGVKKNSKTTDILTAYRAWAEQELV